MRASRYTFATIDAAAIEPSRASPPTIGVCGHAIAGNRARVDEHVVGRSREARSPRGASPRGSRRSVFRRSTSLDESSATQTATACSGSPRRAPRAARRVSCFESSRPGSCTRAGSTTAAATSGPASGPTPTSSTPATTPRARREQPPAQREQPRDAPRLAAARRRAGARARGELARAAARVALQEPQPARLERGRDAEREPRAQLGERPAGSDRRRCSRSSLVRLVAVARARARARGAAARAGARAPPSRGGRRARGAAGVPSTRAPGGTSLCTPDCGPMNALAPICRWPAMPGLREQHDARARAPSSPAMPACATMMQRSPIVQLCPICTRLSILVPRPIRVSPSVPRSTVEFAPISTSSSIHDAADVVDLGEPAALLRRRSRSRRRRSRRRAGARRDRRAPTPPRSRSARGSRSPRRRAPRRRARRPGAARVRAPDLGARGPPRSAAPIDARRVDRARRRRRPRVGWMPGAGRGLGHEDARGAIEVAARVVRAQRAALADVEPDRRDDRARAATRRAAPRSSRARTNTRSSAARVVERRDAGHLAARDRLRATRPSCVARSPSRTRAELTSAREQHRDGRRAHDRGGVAAEEVLGDAVAPVGAHHDQARPSPRAPSRRSSRRAGRASTRSRAPAPAARRRARAPRRSAPPRGPCPSNRRTRGSARRGAWRSAPRGSRRRASRASRRSASTIGPASCADAGTTSAVLLVLRITPLAVEPISAGLR